MYEFDDYHIFLVLLGCGIAFSYWVPRFFLGREPAAATFLILGGAAAFYIVPGMPLPIDPTANPLFWEVTSELAVITALFGVGLRIDDVFAANWRPTVRLLAIAMPLTIGAVALLGWSVAGMTVAGAVLLGAALAPTDPVLAGDLQVGPPLMGRERPIRFALTTEAGLNDGLAFPFVWLGLLIAADGVSPGSWALEWFARDVVYRIAVGTVSGAAIGWLVGQVVFSIPRGNPLARTESGVVAMAGVLVGYGLTELLEGYGFIAAFMTGLVLRRVEERHEFHTRLHAFSESIEHALTAVILFALGGALPALWPMLDLTYVLIGLALIFVIRPLAGWLSLYRTDLRPAERAIIGFYGIRGVGSIYYLSYAAGHIEFVNEPQLWAMVGYTILASTIVHGFTAGVVVRRWKV
ncbi:MAG TPA: cation:proton antiporter [Steroidobacteraceae bacterium]|nr:cation:proton antiporter [Steroidobacteraceae bacterium]